MKNYTIVLSFNFLNAVTVWSFLFFAKFYIVSSRNQNFFPVFAFPPPVFANINVMGRRIVLFELLMCYSGCHSNNM